MAKTDIEWSEMVWNPITGCTKVSEGCKFCYAESMAKRFWGDRKFSDIKFHEDRLEIPKKWKKPRMVFVNSMSDLFHKKVLTIQIFYILFKIRIYEKHIFQVLTKRSKRMRELINKMHKRKSYETIPNLWLGVTVENTKTVERIADLVETPAAVRFISFEPLLEHIDLYSEISERNIDWTKIDWAIIGCESGPAKRSCSLHWINELKKDLEYFNIPVFIKQININGVVEKDVNKFPENLRVRNYPKVKNAKG